MAEQINVQSLRFSYQKNVPILDIQSLVIPLGGFTILHGRSGSGKSTFLKILAGLLPKYGGQLSGNFTISRNLSTTMMFQDPSMQFALDTPRHEIEFALENKQVSHDLIASRVDTILKETGISPLSDRQFNTLSGGEQQRATLAAVIALDSDIILLDEPFASLDQHNRSLIMEQLVKLSHKGKTIIIADHDLTAYSKINPQIVEFTHHSAFLMNTNDAQNAIQKALKKPRLMTMIPNRRAVSAITIDNYLLKRQNLTLIHEKGKLKIIKNKVTILTGESGSGKSSFFKSLIKLVPYSGKVTVSDRDLNSYKLRTLGNTIGLIFQHANDQFLNITVKEELNLSKKNGYFPYFENDRLKDILKTLGLDNLQDRIVYSLSGGQKKKLQILLMLMMDQEILLMDEPFSGLDESSINNVVKLIERCQTVQPRTIILISHRLTGINSLIDFHLVLKDHHFSYVGEANDES